MPRLVATVATIAFVASSIALPDRPALAGGDASGSDGLFGTAPTLPVPHDPPAGPPPIPVMPPACSGSAVCNVTVDRARTVTATFVAALHRPDALVRSSSSVQWTGDNVYSSAGVGEAITIGVARGATVSFEVAAQNDGSVADVLTAGASGSLRGVSVAYFDGATEVTSAVERGAYATDVLSPGMARVLTARVTVAKSVRLGTQISYRVAVSSHGLSDSVIVVVRVASP